MTGSFAMSSLLNDILGWVSIPAFSAAAYWLLRHASWHPFTERYWFPQEALWMDAHPVFWVLLLTFAYVGVLYVTAWMFQASADYRVLELFCIAIYGMGVVLASVSIYAAFNPLPVPSWVAGSGFIAGLHVMRTAMKAPTKPTGNGR